MEMIPPPHAPAVAQASNTTAADAALDRDQLQTSDATTPADAAAAPADGQTPDGFDAAAEAAALEAPVATDGAALSVDTDAAGQAGSDAAPSSSGEQPAGAVDAHGAAVGGHGNFAPLRPDGQLGLQTADDHQGIQRDVPALHLFEAAGTLDPNSGDAGSLPNSAELHTAVVADDSQERSFGPINIAPIATDDVAAIGEDGVLTGATVLANDRDADGDGLRAELVEGPAHGALTLNLDGTFTYTPDADYNGSDFFTYKAVDAANAASGAALVVLTVTSVNDAPVAANDSYELSEDATLAVDKGGLLANDSDVLHGAPSENNGPLTATLVDGPVHGSLTLHADGTFTYTPDAGYNGKDSFTYQAVDGHDAVSQAATVSLTVVAVNDDPVGTADSYEINHNSTLSVIASGGVLANDSDVDSNNLTAVLVDGPAHGSLTLNADGSFSYTPGNGFAGADSFTYHAHDGQADSDTVTVSINVLDGNDNLAGTPSHDVLNGGHGNDVIYGRGSGDELNGGADDDRIYGGNSWWWDFSDGSDTIDGGTGNDHVYGSTGNDSIGGGDGNDYLFGNNNYPYYYYYRFYYYGADDDVIDGGKGDDHIYGSTGNDTISGGEGNDYIAGNSDDLYYYYYYDYYYGDYSYDNDWIDSGPGNDTISCSSYDNEYYGYWNSDDDTVAISSLNGYDLIEGFDGGSYGQDIVTLDALFDALGVADGERAGRVQIDNAGAGVWNVTVDADGDSGNGCEALVAQIQSSEAITVGQDVLIGLAA